MLLILAAALAAAATWALLAYLRLSLVVAYLLAINIITFISYGFDKFAARRQWTRVPERMLPLLAGQRVWRHKTIKGRFRAWFWGIMVLQVTAIAVLLYFSLSRRERG